MRLVWRRSPATGQDHELLWLAVSVAAFAGAALWLRIGLAWPRCPFLSVTGFPCLTCGATRALIAMAHGDFWRAVSWNPLACLALCGVFAFDLYAIAVLISRSARLRLVDWTKNEKNAVRIAAAAVIALNWIYLLAHRAQF
jgi:hypothetical protein